MRKIKAKPDSTKSFEQAIEQTEAAPVVLPEKAAAPAPLDSRAAFFEAVSSRAGDQKKLAEHAKINPEWVAHVDKNGFNALTLALLAKKHALADALIDLGSDVNQTSKEMGWNPLTVACAALEGQDALPKKLLARGANPASKTHHGLYALTSACTFGNLALAKQLLDAGVPASPDDAAWLPIIAASGSRNAPLVELLIARGADASATLSVKNGFSAIHQAAKVGEMATIKTLLAAKVSVDAMTMEGMTALHFAAERGYAEVATALLKAGASPHLENIAGKIAAELSETPAFAKALAAKQPRTKHPLSGKPKKENAATLGEAPEPIVKAAKKAPAKKVAAKKAPAKKSAMTKFTESKAVAIKTEKDKKATVKAKDAAKKTTTKKAGPNKLKSK